MKLRKKRPLPVAAPAARDERIEKMEAAIAELYGLVRRLEGKAGYFSGNFMYHPRDSDDDIPF